MFAVIYVLCVDTLTNIVHKYLIRDNMHILTFIREFM